MDNVTPEILEAIKRSLPAQTVGILQQELKELDRLRHVDDKLDERIAEIHQLEQSNNTLQKELYSYKIREKDLVARENVVLDKEIKLENDILKIRLEESEKRIASIFDLSKTVFRNSFVQETIHKNYSNGGSPYWSPNGNYAPPVETSITKTLSQD